MIADKFQLSITIVFFLFLLKKAVLTFNHNLCFGAKIRQNRHSPEYTSFAI